jgi:hypothetical protein
MAYGSCFPIILSTAPLPFGCSSIPVRQYSPNRLFRNYSQVITGGEPLLRKYLALCGGALRERGFHWGIVTNGYDYTSNIHARLLAAGMGTVILSLDGLENSHNWLRANKKVLRMRLRRSAAGMGTWGPFAPQERGERKHCSGLWSTQFDEAEQVWREGEAPFPQKRAHAIFIEKSVS